MLFVSDKIQMFCEVMDHPQCQQALLAILRRPSKLVQCLDSAIIQGYLSTLPQMLESCTWQNSSFLGGPPYHLRILCTRGYHRTPAMVSLVTAWLLATQLHNNSCNVFQVG